MRAALTSTSRRHRHGRRPCAPMVWSRVSRIRCPSRSRYARECPTWAKNRSLPAPKVGGQRRLIWSARPPVRRWNSDGGVDVAIEPLGPRHDLLRHRIVDAEVPLAEVTNQIVRAWRWRGGWRLRRRRRRPCRRRRPWRSRTRRSGRRSRSSGKAREERLLVPAQSQNEIVILVDRLATGRGAIAPRT